MSRAHGSGPPGLELALHYAALGWHVFPLNPRDKRTMAGCRPCRGVGGRPAHPYETCPCLLTGAWCHGVRAATVDPARLTAWWTAEPRAVPGIAAGPSGLCLIDIDTDHEPLPDDLARALLPGIDLTAEAIPAEAWNNKARFRDGRDSLSLLARLRGESNPWPQGDQHRPVTSATPSGGWHLWYRAPADNLHQVIAKTTGPSPYGLAWQVDIKAGWSYGIAPGATAGNGLYRILRGDPAHVGTFPAWFATEVVRVASQRTAAPPTQPAAPPRTNHRADHGDRVRAYVEAVLADRIPGIENLDEGRPTALSALAYRIAGHLAAAGLTTDDYTQRLIDAGVRSGLKYRIAERTLTRSIASGRSRPMDIPAP
ncbi:hypothetical protein ABIA31_009360 [Catenulispora sp. MAP5-51]|uniref:bifunctional DNA primase/polymerase n=1 Tax=Catenulispora sp. MAP5-51 TaxID=3156298 RepID=UPI003511D71E